jgi:CPA2 family monovalent cation:H+ antiporter-2
MVVAISDPVGQRNVLVSLRKLNPHSCIFVRTRYLRDMEELYRLGATEVIPEEFETSIEIFSRVLAKYLVPIPEVEHFIRELRQDSYDMLRAKSLTTREWSSMHVSIADSELSTLQLSAQSPMVGQTVCEASVKATYGIHLLAIRREGHMLYEVIEDTALQPEDTLYVFGRPDAVTRFANAV